MRWGADGGSVSQQQLAPDSPPPPMPWPLPSPPPPSHPLPPGTDLLSPAQKQQLTVRLAALSKVRGNSTSYPCTQGDARCFCGWKRATGYWADTDRYARCAFFYWCYTRTSGGYFRCKNGLLFNAARDACTQPRSAARPTGAVCPLASPPPSSPPPTSSPPIIPPRRRPTPPPSSLRSRCAGGGCLSLSPPPSTCRSATL